MITLLGGDVEKDTSGRIIRAEATQITWLLKEEEEVMILFSHINPKHICVVFCTPILVLRVSKGGPQPLKC